MGGRRSKSDPGTTDARSDGRGEQPLDALCAVAARLFEADAAALTLHHGGVSQVVGSCGLAARFRRYAWSFDAVSYGPDDIVLAHQAGANADAQLAAHALGLQSAGFFVRAPVSVGADFAAALLILAKADKPRVSARQKRILLDLVALMRQEFAPLEATLLDPHNDVTIALTFEEATQRVAQSEHPECILDAVLNVRSANRRFADLVQTPLPAFAGQPIAATGAPAADLIASLAKRALDRKLSPPDVEIVHDDEERRRVYQLTVSPFSPKDTKDYFALVRLREVTALDALARRISMSVDRSAAQPALREPSLAFLDETLVRRRTIRTRHELSYLTLRAWRRPIREYQIKALRALKANIPGEMPALVAAEMEAEARSLIGVTAFRAVVPVPCGHTQGPCLSLEIARALSAAIGAPVMQAFAAPRRPGSSHPKDNARRPPLMLTRTIAEPVILVDDVATSGSHLEEAAALLRPHCGALLAVAWIGGDSV